MEFFGQYFEAEMISFAVVACAFSGDSEDIYFEFVYNFTTTYSWAYVLRLVEFFLPWLQIDHLNGFQLFFIENILILHLIMQLYSLILYLFVLDGNTINSYRYIDKLIQLAVAIGLHECHCINITYPKKWIDNLHGYSIDSCIIHASKIVPSIKNRDKTTIAMEENNTDINSILKLIDNQLFSISFYDYYYVIFLRILIHNNLLPSYAAKDAWLNSGSIVIKKNINVPNTRCYIIANVMDYLYDGWINLFGLIKRNCINILIIFIGISNIEVISCLIIIGEYNLMCFMRVIVFVVNGDEQIILLQKKTEKNDEQSLIWSLKKAKSYKK